MVNNCTILNNSLELLGKVKEHDNNIHVMKFVKNTNDIDACMIYQNIGVGISKSTTDYKDLITYAHQKNLLVNVFTSADPTEDETIGENFPDIITTQSIYGG